MWRGNETASPGLITATPWGEIITDDLGKTHVITGPGEGKTTAAFGLAMRASGHGLKVCIIQFMKTGETTGEVIAAKRLKNVEVFQFGTGKFVDPKALTPDDNVHAREGVDFVKRRLAKGNLDLLILDEVNIASSFGLVDSAEMLKILGSRGSGIEVVLTGRNAPMDFIESADYVSIIESRKHPMDKGLKPRKGIEW